MHGRKLLGRVSLVAQDHENHGAEQRVPENTHRGLVFDCSSTSGCLLTLTLGKMHVNTSSLPPQITFRPRRSAGFLGSLAIAALLSMVFFAAGIVCFVTAGPHPFSFGFAILGFAGVAASVGSMLTRTVVTTEGITKRPIISGGFTLQWRDVDSWEQLPRRTDDAPCVRFHIRGSRFPRTVIDYEVEQPGFVSFLNHVRQHASQKEKA